MAARYDNKKRKLKTGEAQKTDGSYSYRWTTKDGKRHSITAPTLEELRKREDLVIRDKTDGIKQNAGNVTLNSMFELWQTTKRGLKDNTMQNYSWAYNQYVYDDAIGRTPIQKLKRSDLKRFYNRTIDEKRLKISTVDNIHTVLHQVIQLAVDDDYIRKNISDNLLGELKRAHNKDEKHRRALTMPEQELFLSFLKNDACKYNHWYNIFAVMVGSGLRVGEVTGLRWEDIDLEEGIISVNHTLVYYCHRNEDNHYCSFAVNTPKTKAGNRVVPMTDEVKEAFNREKAYQEFNNLQCKAEIDGYTNFVFINRFGSPQHQGTLNKALSRITRDCNDEQMEKNTDNPLLLPNFSCHTLRHTFVTRLVEAGVNIKVVQQLAGHSSCDVTLDVYTSVFKEFTEREFEKFKRMGSK